MPEPPKPGTSKQFGKYHLIAHLATGGMADIYLASQTALAGFEKLIVIKRILPNLSREARFVEMFLDEARIAATLNHPNVVQIFDLGRIQGQYFIAMEYLPGESLSTIIRGCRRRKIRIPPELAAGMILQAAEGLHHAHTRTARDGSPLGIVHRDVSPQNVFVLYDGGVKVVDFGIAKAELRSTKTQTGTLKGKYAYMSPEQIAGEELDGRSDVFALGVVLWECLARRKLFNQENDLKLLQAVTEQDAPSPREVDPQVPELLAEITKKALARNRDQRYQSAAEFRSALRLYLKASASDWDNVVIGNFMQDLFSDRIKEKRQLIESAQSSDSSIQDYLFGDLSDYLSDTEHSVPRSPVSGSAIIPQLRGIAAPKRRPVWPIVLAVLGLLAGSGAVAMFMLMKKDQGPKKADAGLVAVVEKPDASTPTPPADTSADPGEDAAPDSTGPLDGAALAPADESQPEKITKPPKRKKKKKRRRRRVAIKKPEEKIEKPPPGPPGKLRLTTNPWTDVYHHGRHLGQTPLIDVELPSGKVRLRVVNKEQGIDKTITVVIKPGERTTKRFNLF
jgi:serine/threonine-protein kinase